jgi:mono/diheme cytochrome c family protein
MLKVFGKMRGRKYLVGLILLVGVMAAMGCSQGAYPLDIFYEMHYQQSFKVNEPPRLSVPESAVAWFPPPQSTSFGNDAAHLYQVNCSMCHGATGRGDGPVLQKMMDTYGYTPAVPADLTDPVVQAMNVTGIQGFMSAGIIVMPNFSKVLTPEEINMVAEYVVNCLQGARLEVCP